MQLLKYMHTDHSHNEEYKCLILENNLLGQIICISELHTPTARMIAHVGSFGNRIISEI